MNGNVESVCHLLSIELKLSKRVKPMLNRLPRSFNIVEQAHAQLHDVTMVTMDAKTIAKQSKTILCVASAVVRPGDGFSIS